MATITKKDLVAEISKVSGRSSDDALAVVEGFMEAVSNHLAAGNAITLRTFGTFELRLGGGKVGRNPKQSGTDAEIAERFLVRFRPSGELKQRAAAIPLGAG